MPRPKSALTGRQPRSLVARLTEEQHIMFLRLGGSRWLRGVIEQEINKRKEGNSEGNSEVNQQRV